MRKSRTAEPGKPPAADWILITRLIYHQNPNPRNPNERIPTRQSRPHRQPLPHPRARLLLWPRRPHRTSL